MEHDEVQSGGLAIFRQPSDAKASRPAHKTVPSFGPYGAKPLPLGADEAQSATKDVLIEQLLRGFRHLGVLK